MTTGLDQIKDYVLTQGVDDWVQLMDVAWSSSQAFPEAARPDKIARGTEAIKLLLEGGLIRVGDVRRGEGFVAWDVSPGQAADRIEAEWTSLPEEPSLGDICWIELTEAGDAQAKIIGADH